MLAGHIITVRGPILLKIKLYSRVADLLLRVSVGHVLPNTELLYNSGENFSRNGKTQLCCLDVDYQHRSQCLVNTEDISEEINMVESP